MVLTRYAILLCAIVCTIHAHAQEKKSEILGKVILDNEKVRVTQYESQSGKDVCGSGKHSHGPHLTILLTDARVTITMEDGKVVTSNSPGGTTFWSEAETHIVINSGKAPIRAQIVEYKPKN